MTVKRDLKRRIRLRQARTGESYVTARRHVLAQRDAADPRVRASPTDPPVGESPIRDDAAGGEAEAEPVGREAGAEPVGDQAGLLAKLIAVRATPVAAVPVRGAIEVEDFDGAFSVVELQDVTAEAAQLGYRCRVTLYPDVLEACELTPVLLALRDALVGAAGDPETARLFGMAFGVGVDDGREPWELLRGKRQAEMSTVLRSLYGGSLVFQVAGRDKPVDLVCRPWNHGRTLVLRRLSELAVEVGRNIASGSRTSLGPAAAFSLALRTATLGRHPVRELALEGSIEDALRSALAPHRGLFVLYSGRRYRIGRRTFVIGRDRKVADLVIKDGLVSREHAAVLYRDGAHYLKDLDSTHGITYKGMRISNKRIDEGDVFQIGDHELRFTYQPANPP